MTFLQSWNWIKTDPSPGALRAPPMAAPPIRPVVAELPAVELDRLREAVRARLPAGPDGSITCTARANAVTGRRPL